MPLSSSHRQLRYETFRPSLVFFHHFVGLFLSVPIYLHIFICFATSFFAFLHIAHSFCDNRLSYASCFCSFFRLVFSLPLLFVCQCRLPGPQEGSGTLSVGSVSPDRSAELAFHLSAPPSRPAGEIRHSICRRHSKKAATHRSAWLLIKFCVLLRSALSSCYRIAFRSNGVAW